MKFKILPALCLILFLPLSPAYSYVIKRLDIEQGLSNNYVVGITQDKTGFMWFATESGLNRFDGKDFKVYKKFFQNTDGISGNELNKVLADSAADVVWIATQRAGLNRYDCQTDSFQQFKQDPANSKSIISNAITTLENDTCGNLWIGTYDLGVDYYNNSTKEFIHYNRSTVQGLVSNQIWSIAGDKKGKLYIGHVYAGFSILSVKSKTVKNFVHIEGDINSLPDNDVRCVFIDKSENIWVGTRNGLALFNPETERFICFYHQKDKPNSLASNTIFSITQTNDNRLWIGTEKGGVSILDVRKEMFLSPENISFQNIYQSDDDSGLSHSTVRAIYQDRFNNIWIGTYSGGINFISHIPEYFHKWQHSAVSAKKNILNVKEAWGMCEDIDGNIWVGTDGGGIHLFKKGILTEVYTKENSKLTDNAILTALRDSEGDLWFGSFQGGVCVYRWKTKQFEHFSPAGFDAQIIRSLYEDNRKNIWIGTDRKGLYSYNLTTHTLKHFTAEKDSLPADNLIRSIAVDRQDRLWIGSFGEGLTILDTTFRVVKTFNTSSGFYSNTINCIFRDSQNRIWIGTGEGLILFPADEISNYTLYTGKDGLKSSHIRAVTEDKDKNIWFSTNAGIGEWINKEQKFHNYSPYEGVPQGNFMSGSVVNSKEGSPHPASPTRGGDEMIYFGSQNGVCYFNPVQIPEITRMPTIIITGFKYYPNDKNDLSRPEDNEKSLPLNSSIRLKYNQNTFAITFNVMDYALSHLIEYAYRLNGQEDSWYNIGNTNEVTFRNLRPGKYDFVIKARLYNQEWSNVTASLQVEIFPPLWLTWWAKLLYILSIAGIIVYLIIFYKKRMILENMLYFEKQHNLQQQLLNDEKLQFFTNIAHELRSPLTLIVGPMEDLLNDSTLAAKAEKKLRLIYQSATRLLELVNKILDFRKTETHNMPLCISKGDLTKLVKEVCLKYKELNRNPNLSFSTSIEAENTTLYFDPENVRIILDNLISNAFKYTSQGEIKVCLRNVSENNIQYTEIEVADTGCGIPKEDLKKIFNRYYQVKSEHQPSGTGIGLSLVKNLAAIHQGTIQVESDKGKGTSFKFRLRTDNTYPEAFHKKVKEEQPIYIPEIQDETETASRKGIMLIVEDNQEIRNYIWDNFADNYLVLTADNGKAGLELAIKNVPDIIISDVMMPEMSGLELCNAIKADVRTSHIPIILLTAKTTTEDKTGGYSAGADSYITKPFSASLLKSRVSNLLESRKKLALQLIHSKMYKQTILSESVGQLDKEFLAKLTKIIENNIRSEKLDIEYIAQQVNMSHSTLYRKIRTMTGFSINEFIRKIKMKHAEDLLLTGKYTVSEIAFHVGIDSIPYFRQCFKEEFGMTPSEYLKSLNVNNS